VARLNPARFLRSAMRLRLRHVLVLFAVAALAVGLGWIALLRQQRDLARLETRALEAENRALRQQLEAESILAAALARRDPAPAAP